MSTYTWLIPMVNVRKYNHTNWVSVVSKLCLLEGALLATSIGDLFHNNGVLFFLLTPGKSPWCFCSNPSVKNAWWNWITTICSLPIFRVELKIIEVSPSMFLCFFTPSIWGPILKKTTHRDLPKLWKQTKGGVFYKGISPGLSGQSINFFTKKCKVNHPYYIRILYMGSNLKNLQSGPRHQL